MFVEHILFFTTLFMRSIVVYVKNQMVDFKTLITVLRLLINLWLIPITAVTDSSFLLLVVLITPGA